MTDEEERKRKEKEMERRNSIQLLYRFAYLCAVDKPNYLQKLTYYLFFN